MNPKNAITLLLAPVLSAAAPLAVVSPNGMSAISLDCPAGGSLSYSVSFQGKPVIEDSVLGLEIENQPPLGTNFRVVSERRGTIDETYRMPHGKSDPVRDHCRTLAVVLEENGPLARRLTIEARAYDDGVAFRYVVPKQPLLPSVRLTAESTQFNLAKEGTAYALFLLSYQTMYEDEHITVPLAGIRPDLLIGLPLLIELPGTAWVGITEANIDNYPGLYLAHDPERAHGRRLHARLSPSLVDPGVAFQGVTPFASPWRVLMLGTQPGRLVESNIVLNLNPPSAIADTSWIKPGKTAWDWWSGDYDTGVGFKPGMNTPTMEHYVDFAGASGFPYMLIDAGWAAGGHGHAYAGANLTQTVPEIDLPEILRYAKSKGVGIWLWANWEDIDSQADVCFPRFEKWGVVGVKIDFMSRDDQWMVDFYRRILRQAAAHHLMIDYHGAYKPDGIRRTWPNLLTREGVMGAEYNKITARITPEHNVMLAFTRMLAGPMDYTPGGFDNVTRAQFVPRWTLPEVMSTRAHGLALYVVFESALQMVSDYPETYANQPAFDFIKAVPTAWDETHVLGGRPDDCILIARRRGKEWFVGGITGARPQHLDLNLRFLGAGQYLAEIYGDAPDAAENPKHTLIERRSVDDSGTIPVTMAAGGGVAIRFRPASP